MKAGKKEQVRRNMKTTAVALHKKRTASSRNRYHRDWMMLIRIFWTFLKIGPVTFGGGYAMIPVIEREVVSRRKWLETTDVGDIFAVAQSVPGAAAINSATFIGYRLAGVGGAVAAMAGILLPTFLVMTGLSLIYMSIRDNPLVAAAFESIRATIVALICYAAIKIGRTAVLDKTTLVLATVTVIVLFVTPIHPVLVLAGGGAAGIGAFYVRRAMGMKTRLEPKRKREEHTYDDYFIGDGI